MFRKLLLLTCLFISLSASIAAIAKPGGRPPASVETATASQQWLSPKMQVPGTVVSLNDAKISAQVQGTIVWIVQVGSHVQTGEIIAQLDPNLLEIKQQQAQAQVQRLTTELSFADKTLKRQQALTSNSNAAFTQLERSQADRDIIKHQLSFAKASLAQAKILLQHTHITTPFAGVVVEKINQLGSFVQVGTPIVRLIDTDNIEVSARVPGRILRLLKPNTQVMVSDGQQQNPAIIRSVIPVGDKVSRMMEVRIKITSHYLIGSAVKVEFPSANAKDVIVVPQDSIIFRANKAYLFIVSDQNTAIKVPVTTGLQKAGLVEVTGALKQGDQVVIRGGERLSDGRVLSVPAK